MEGDGSEGRPRRGVRREGEGRKRDRRERGVDAVEERGGESGRTRAHRLNLRPLASSLSALHILCSQNMLSECRKRRASREPKNSEEQRRALARSSSSPLPLPPAAKFGALPHRPANQLRKTNRPAREETEYRDARKVSTQTRPPLALLCPVATLPCFSLGTYPDLSITHPTPYPSVSVSPSPPHPGVSARTQCSASDPPLARPPTSVLRPPRS